MPIEIPCQVCGKKFNSVKLVIDSKSGIVVNINSPDFQIVPLHDPTPGLKVLEVYTENDGRLYKSYCAGSLKPRKKPDLKIIEAVVISET